MEETPLSHRYSFVVVTFYTGPILERCLAQLANMAAQAEIIIVNNGNPHKTEAMLNDWCLKGPKRHWLSGHGNIGFGAGCNLGVSRATGEVLVFLNPDCLVPKDICAQIETGLAQTTARDLMGVWATNMAGQPDVTNIRAEAGFLSVLSLRFPVLTKLPGVTALNISLPHDPEKLPSPYAVEGVGGACLILYRDMFLHLSGFDSDFFLHFEDLDVQKRLKRAGGKIYLLPHLHVVHDKSSSEISQNFVQKHKIISWFLYMSKHSPWRIGRIFWRAGVLVVRMLLRVPSRLKPLP